MDNTRYKIALVDDNIATLNQGKSLLQAFYKVYTIQSAATLFENLEHDIPDLILLDVEMPGMDGFQTISKLKANPRYKDIPVIFLTAKSDEESEKKGFSLGAVDYIFKPFSGPLLQKRISNQILYRRVEAAVKDYSSNLEVMMDEIARANERTRILLDKTPICARLWDTNMDMIDCNEAAVKLFGFKDKEECLKRYSELYPEYQPDGQLSEKKVKKCIDKAFEDGKYTFNWTYKLLDGTLMPAEVILIRVEYEGGYAVAGYTRDLREQMALIEEIRKAQIADESNRAKSRFLANMSHEMRTPLNVVVGLTGLMLEEDKLDRELKENLQKIGTAGSTLLGLINNVLDISKIEADKLELMPVEYELPSLLNDVITLNMVRIEENPIAFHLDIKEDVLCRLHGDDLRVKQIINNLLGNAFKYTKRGTVGLRLTTEHSGSDVWVGITVSDTGVGLSEESQSKLFADYYQVDSDANRRREGTGLGLSITKRLVDMMNGEISVESELEKGSVFHVRICQKFVDNTVIGPAVVENLKNFRFTEENNSAAKKLVRADLSFARVLVVDDMKTNLDVAAGLLGKYKMQVDCVLSGEEAIERMRSGTAKGQQGYNAVFMDHMMPGMDGIETANAIRNLGTEYAREIPIIALTANAIQGTEEMFYANGFQDFLPKPVNVRQLDSVVQKWISNKEL